MRRLNAEQLQGPMTAGTANARAFRVAGRELVFFPEGLDLGLLEGPDDLNRCVSVDVPVAVRPALPPARVGALVLVPTNECNLACRYCYVQGGGRGRVRTGPGAPSDLMSDRTVCRALDLVEAPDARISFFGGEPLLAWGKLRWTVERARRRFRGPRFSVTTNATLLTAGIAEFLEARGFSMIVSIDGPEDLHDAHRRDASGRGTYSRVRGALDLVAARPALARRTTLRGTFLPGEAEIARRLEHLNDLADALGLGNVSIEPAVHCSPACGPAEEFSAGQLTRMMIDGARWCADRARSGRPARWHFLTKALGRLLGRKPAWTECGAARNYLAVMPDGQIHACHKGGAPVGDVIRGIDPGRTGAWKDNRLTARGKCSRCWARLICGGGCRAEGLADAGVVAPGRVSCRLGKARAFAALWTAAELADEPEALARIWRPRGARAPAA